MVVSAYGRVAESLPLIHGKLLDEAILASFLSAVPPFMAETLPYPDEMGGIHQYMNNLDGLATVATGAGRLSTHRPSRALWME